MNSDQTRNNLSIVHDNINLLIEGAALCSAVPTAIGPISRFLKNR